MVNQRVTLYSLSGMFFQVNLPCNLQSHAHFLIIGIYLFAKKIGQNKQEGVNRLKVIIPFIFS